jgi:hypothetical protein
MFLKTAEFTYNGHSLVLNELSALQRLSFPNLLQPLRLTPKRMRAILKPAVAQR